MRREFKFVGQQEKYSVLIRDEREKEGLNMEIFLDFPVVLQNLEGAKRKFRYDCYHDSGNGYQAVIQAEDLHGNCYEISDVWKQEADFIRLDRNVNCIKCVKETGIRLTTEFRCRDDKANTLDDYQFIIPGALYNKNDTDDDGVDDYLGTFSQDYKDDRNPSLSVMAFCRNSKRFISLLRGGSSSER